MKIKYVKIYLLIGVLFAASAVFAIGKGWWRLKYFPGIPSATAQGCLDMNLTTARVKVGASDCIVTVVRGGCYIDKDTKICTCVETVTGVSGNCSSAMGGSFEPPAR